MPSVSLDALIGALAVVLAARLERWLPVPAPLAWVGAGLLFGPLLLGVAGTESARLLVEGAALLVFFEMGLRLTGRQERLVRSVSRRVLGASLLCAVGMFATTVAAAHALGATLPQGVFAGLVLLPVSVLVPTSGAAARSAGALGTGAASLCGLIALPLLADDTSLPGWILALRYVFICIAFVSIALVLRDRLALRRLPAGSSRRHQAGTVVGVLALLGASAWIGPALGVSCFVVGLALSRSRWDGRVLSMQRSGGLRAWGALLFFAGLGVLAGSLMDPVLVFVAVGGAGGLLLVRAGTLAFFKRFWKWEGARNVQSLGAVAFVVLYAGVDAQVLPAAWAAAAPSVLAVAALALAAGRAAEGRLQAAARKTQTSGAFTGADFPALPSSFPHERHEPERRALCHAPFVARPRLAGSASGLHLVRVAPDAPATCLSLRRLSLRRYYGVEIVGLWRHDAYVHAPPEDLMLRAGDHVLISAAPPQLSRSVRIFRTSLH